MEIGAEVVVEVELIPGAAPEWPWLINDEAVMVLTVGENFEKSSYTAIDQGMKLLENK